MGSQSTDLLDYSQLNVGHRLPEEQFSPETRQS